jgi:hypothetical protein
MQTRTKEYFKAKYLPDRVTLMDPSHLQADVVIRVLDHWYDRQGQGKPVLRFQQVLRAGQVVSPPGDYRPGLNKRTQVPRHQSRKKDCKVDPSTPNTDQGRTAATHAQDGPPTVKKGKAGPGRSSESWLGSAASTPTKQRPGSTGSTGHLAIPRLQPRGFHSDLPDLDCSSDGSV